MNIPDYVEDSHRPLWLLFSNWAKNNGVDPDGDDSDVHTWWDCFIAGATAMYLEMKKGTFDT